MKKLLATSLASFFLATGLFAQTYYSRNATSGGNWDAPSAWTFSSDGSGGAAGIPGRTDDVVILSGHTIVVNATNDNGSTGVSANGLGYPNVGTFTNSGSTNFYHTGDVTVNSGGALTFSVRSMFEGYTYIEGTFTSTQDIINVGNMVIASGATFSTDDDMICTGFSFTQIDVTINSDDDIYVDHTDARICGAGTMNVGVNSNNTPQIVYYNSATIAQFCSGFTISCGPDPGCSGFPQTGTGNFTFALDSLAYYRYITIQSSQVAGDLTNFPVLISISSADLRTVSDGGHVESANGYDILFSSSNNCGDLSILPHQIESYTSNGTTGSLVAWVKVPFVSSSSNTEIFMYYGSPDITEDLSTGATFDYDYVNVYHLHNDFDDASAYGNDGTNGGSSDQTNGKIADAQTFGTNDYIQIPTDDMINGEGTYSSWVYSTSFSTNHHYILGHTTTPPYANRLQLYTNDNGGLLDLGMGSSHSENTNIYNFNTSEWYYVVLAWDNPNYTVYVNGNSEATGTYASYNSLQTFMDIGNDGNTGARNENWVGDIDESRMSVVERSATWIETEFNNQDSPGTFFTLGSEIENICIALPIDLLSFTATAVDNSTVRLNWKTASEINNDFFTIERSRDTKNWIEILKKDGAGNSSVILDYQSFDEEPLSGRSYYRLKQTDFDGAFEYSDVVTVFIDDEKRSVVYPNPSSGNVFFSSNIPDLKIESFTWVDVANNELGVNAIHRGQEIEFMTSDFTPGVYFLIHHSGQEQNVYKVVITD